jgi:hypothetical protein
MSMVENHAPLREMTLLSMSLMSSNNAVLVSAFAKIED